jgi:acyl carrier protein
VKTADARTLLIDLLHRIAPECDAERIDPHASFQEAMDLDSMDFLTLLTALHDRTGIDVPERDYASISTLASFADYIARASA